MKPTHYLKSKYGQEYDVYYSDANHCWISDGGCYIEADNIGEMKLLPTEQPEEEITIEEQTAIATAFLNKCCEVAKLKQNEESVKEEVEQLKKELESSRNNACNAWDSVIRHGKQIADAKDEIKKLNVAVEVITNQRDIAKKELAQCEAHNSLLLSETHFMYSEIRNLKLAIKSLVDGFEQFTNFEDDPIVEALKQAKKLL